MAREIGLEKSYLGQVGLQTIYFGGGTPSMLPVEDIENLLSEIRHRFLISDDAEITLEANPDDITKEKLQAWKQAGINRLSMGVQSFFKEELEWMNRAHNAEQAIDSVQLAKKEFDNITLDLIYGSPLLTDEMWKQNVDRAISLGIPHLSCYALTVEEKTPLHKKISSQQVPDVENEKQARQFLLLMQWLRDAGYEHYEVSNFALPGFRSRHNSSYWKGEKYLGIGPSAHSYNGMERRWNVANNQVYIRGIDESTPARDTEILTTTQQLNEYVMISLRTQEGIDLDVIGEKWGADGSQRIQRAVRKFIDSGLITSHLSNLRLTDEGFLRADGIAGELFV